MFKIEENDLNKINGGKESDQKDGRLKQSNI